MRINLRQEIAMWVLGLAWVALAFFGLSSSHGVVDILEVVVFLLVLLVPVVLIIFSLRDRQKSN